MKDINTSRRKLVVGSGAAAVSSVITGGLLPKYAFSQTLVNEASYEVMNIAGVNSSAPFYFMPAESKALLVQQITDLLKNRLEKSFTPLLGQVLGKTMLGAVAPAILIIFDLLFPSGITMEEIREEIDKRIKTALDEYEFIQMQKKFIALIDAYLLRMESVKKNNSGIEDQTKWSLGSPEQWEALIFCCLEIKNYFYNNEQFTRYYEAASLVNDFNSIYFLALNSRLQCFDDGDDVGKTVELMEEFLQGQYNYLEKLVNIAFFDIHHPKDIYLTDFGTPVFQWRTTNYCQNGNSTSLSGYDKYDRIRWTHDMIRERLRLYHLMNTQVINMCEAHSVMVRSFNKLFNKNLPDALSMVNTFIADNYVSVMNDLYRKSPYVDGGGYAGLTLPAFSPVMTSTTAPFGPDDIYVKIQQKSSVIPMRLAPGDYPHILTPNRPGYVGINLIRAEIPRGVRVIFYSEPNFGEYLEEGSDEIRYRGRTYLKPLEGVTDFSDLNKIPDFTVRSMKIRVDPAHWFSEIREKTIGRLPLVEYKYAGGDVWTTGEIVMAQKRG